MHTPHGDARRRRFAVAGAACAMSVLLAVLVLALTGSDKDGSTTEAVVGGPSNAARPAPPIADAHHAGGNSVIASGTGAKGDDWTLYVSGPLRNLCLSVRVPERGVEPGACESPPPGGRSQDRYRPVHVGDSRTSTYVFGRMPADVQLVEVESAGTEVLGRSPVVPRDVERFYVVELKRAADPAAVVGRTGHGAGVRYEMAVVSGSGHGGSGAWLVAGLVIVAVVVLRHRARSPRRLRRGDGGQDVEPGRPPGGA